MNYSFLITLLFFTSSFRVLLAGPIDTASIGEATGLTNNLSSFETYNVADSKIERFISKWGLSGASVAIVKDGRLVYAKGFGYADKEKNIATTPTHSFRVASISKLITAVGIMKLVEDGKISVEDKVFGEEGILNDKIYSRINDNRAYDITVRHLLVHEAGWHGRYGDHMFMPHYIAKYMGTKLPVSTETIIQFALKKGLHFSPGATNSYSNLGYCILGEIIEKVSGKEYEQYIKEEILAPLNIFGMGITSNRYVDKRPNEVKYYDAPGAKYRLSVYSTRDYAPRTYEGTDFETLGAAGGWTASAAELMRLLTAFDGNATCEDMISCNTIERMTTLETPDKYGFGWVHSDNMGNWWRTGTLSGTSAFMMRRCDGISFAFITNSSTWRGAKFAYDIKDMMQDAIGTINWWPSIDLFPYLLNSEGKFQLPEYE